MSALRGGIFAAFLLLLLTSVARSALPLYVHPEDRAAGTRRDVAVRIGHAILTVLWPATVEQIRVDGIDGHQVAGIVLSGVKFHRALHREEFLAEVASLITESFAAGDVEEVDIWATVPIPVRKGAIVSGDLAVSTTRTVFSCTVTRDRLSHLDDLLHVDGNAYWAPDFAMRLQKGT